MGDNWIQNSLIVALLILIAGGIINYILGFGLELIGLDISYVNDLGFLLIAYILGLIYTKRVGQIMPKGLRLKSVGLFFVFYLLATFLITYIISQGEFMVVAISVALGSFFILIECLIIYWIFGFAGNLYMKNLKKDGQMR